MPPAKINVRALQLSVEGLFKLLGGSEDDRQKFFEKLKGITTPREAVLVNSHISALAGSLNTVKDATKALQSAARQQS